MSLRKVLFGFIILIILKDGCYGCLKGCTSHDTRPRPQYRPPPSTPPPVITCNVDGNSYYNGDIFYPLRTCKICTCFDGFNGDLVEPYCKQRICDAETRFSKEIKNKCKPMYTHGQSCCPDDFNCSS